MKKILTILILVLSLNLVSKSQTYLDHSKQEILSKIEKDSNYINIIINKDYIEYDFAIDNEIYSHDIKYLKKDTCHKYTSVTELINYNLELQVFHDLYGVPVISNTWVYKSNGNYRIASIEIINEKVVSTITSYNNYEEYTNAVYYVMNPTDDYD